MRRLGASFPFGTLAVNVVGCFLIGGLSELAEARAYLAPETRAFLIIGLLGGFTTFSAFGNETVNLLRDLMGYGAHSRLHTFKIEHLSQDLPMVVEIVDTRDKLEAFLDLIDDDITEGLATLEKAEVRFYRMRKSR